jgi:polyhydroxyalkanoate synthesis regulator phasin
MNKENVDDLMNQAFNKIGTEQFENENYTKLVTIFDDEVKKLVNKKYQEKLSSLSDRIEEIGKNYVSRESVNNRFDELEKKIKTLSEQIVYLADQGRT